MEPPPGTSYRIGFADQRAADIISIMGTTFEELEKQARALSPKEKAALARILIDELDTSVDADAEELWIEEAQRRYNAFIRGELQALPGDEVMRRVRSRLK